MKSKKHTKRENFCLSPQIQGLLEAMAEASGQTKSEVLRGLILDAAKASGGKRNAPQMA